MKTEKVNDKKEVAPVETQIRDFIISELIGKFRTTNTSLRTEIYKRFNLHLSSVNVRKYIHNLRSDGALILADSRGYYFCDLSNAEQTFEYIESLRSRAYSILKVADRMFKATNSTYASNKLIKRVK